MRTTAAFCLFTTLAGLAAAEDTRTQYPWWLRDSFIELNVGSISYPFSEANLESGNSAGSVSIPHAGARVTLFGHRFNRYVSGQISLMRPVQWVTYQDVNGTTSSHSVWVSVGGITARGTLPLGDRFSIFGEGGLGIVSRHGFERDGTTVLTDANYATTLWSTGLSYRLNSTWDLQSSVVYTPANEEVRQPRTVMVAAGVALNLHALPEDRVRANASSGAIFPRNTLQLGGATNGLGIGANNLFSDTVPIFWGGNVKISEGITVRYQRNLFHTKKLFGFDGGVSAASWQSAGGARFWTASVYPQFRFMPIRTGPADIYLFYSVAGPTFISRSFLDGQDTGKRFTFQDLIGVGGYLGRNRRVNIEVSIGHFSNGNTFSHNAGIMIPLTFTGGYTF